MPWKNTMAAESDTYKRLERALTEPRALGNIERNVEVKVVALVLELLGYDPVTEVQWAYQLPTIKDRGIRSPKEVSREADVVVGTPNLVYTVGEVKAPDVNPISAKEQLLGYMRTVGATRGFATNGHQWEIYERTRDSGAISVGVANIPHIGAYSVRGPGSVAGLLPYLDRFLSRDNCPPQPWKNLRGSIRVRGQQIRWRRATWDTADYPDPVAGTLAAGIARAGCDSRHGILLKSSTKTLYLCLPAKITQVSLGIEPIRPHFEEHPILVRYSPHNGPAGLYLSRTEFAGLGITGSAWRALAAARRPLSRRWEIASADQFADALAQALS
jgi:hypothetical protein